MSATQIVVVTAAPIASNPVVQQNSIDFISGAEDPNLPPPKTPAGRAGFLIIRGQSPNIDVFFVPKSRGVRPHDPKFILE